MLPHNRRTSLEAAQEAAANALRAKADWYRLQAARYGERAGQIALRVAVPPNHLRASSEDLADYAYNEARKAAHFGLHALEVL